MYVFYVIHTYFMFAFDWKPDNQLLGVGAYEDIRGARFPIRILQQNKHMDKYAYNKTVLQVLWIKCRAGFPNPAKALFW